MSSSHELAEREKAGSQSARHRPLSRRRKWGFRLFAVGMSLAPFLLLEAGLRIGGFGYETKFIVEATQTDSQTAFHFNPLADRAYYGPEDLSGPEPRQMEIPKPQAVYRIVVVGGSTVAGFPYPFELAFPKHLEVILRQQQPATDFEVLNAGITSINSFSELDIVRQVVACEPDLIVVHSGHNEFYGPGGSASTAGGLTPALYPLLQITRRQRSFQLLTSLMPKPKNPQLFETLPADSAIPLDGKVVERTRTRFRSNLQKIVATAERAGIPIVLSTVPCNLRDLSPLQTSFDVRRSESESEAQTLQLREAMRHISYNRYDLALQTLTEARRADPTHPLLAYRQAQCFEMLDRNEEAADAFTAAADLDGCRLRAPSSFADVVREVAGDETGGVYFCDVAAQFRGVSRYSVPGDDLFLEHVHYNLAGNWQAARMLAECIVKDVFQTEWHAERLPDDQQRDRLLHVTPFDHLVADALTLGVLGVRPFSLSADREKEVQVVQDRWRSTYASLPQLDRELFTSQPLASMTENVLVVMGNAYLSVGRNDLALANFELNIRRRPWDASGYVGAVSSLRAQGKLSEAQEMLEQVTQLAPRDARVQDLLKASTAIP